MGFFDNVKKDDVESHNKDDINNKDKPAEDEEKKEIQHVHSEESVLKDRKIDEQTAIRNFRYLDELIHSGANEIVLDSDIVLSDDEELQYLEGIKLDVDDLIMNGNGHRINAQGKARIFDCTGKDIIIRDIVLANGYAQKGGAIQNAGDLTLIEVELHDNTAERGGAIHNYKGNLKIIQSTISNNKTLKGSGGAIVNHRGDLRMVQSSLIQNTAFVGGAIYNYKSELTIIESVIDENTAEKYGGAIINSGKLTINQSSLEANNAEYGGAIYNLEHGFSSEESPVSELTGINYDLDGTIFNFDLMRICNSKKDSIELDNHCAINRVKSILFINDSTFTQNTADCKGGAIYSEGDALKISQSSITKNVAKDGGGICNRRGDLVIKDSKFQANRAEYQGDAIINHGNIFILSEDIGDNIANFGEMPAVESLKDNQRDFTYLNELIRSKSNEIKLEYDILLNIENLENQTFKNGIKIDCDDLIIDGAGHSIDAQGIVRIFECNAKDVKIKNIKLKNGSGKNDGCAIRNFGELIITDSLLTNNIAKYGAAISNYGDLTIKESSFADNESDYGAAIYNNHNLAIVESSFMNNESEFRGGAIYNNEGELTVNSSTFNNNTAQESGGAIYNRWEGKLTITESTLNNNTAHESGGAIYSKNEIHMNDCTLIDNLQFSFSFVENNNNKYDIKWDDDVISSNKVTIYLDNKCDGEYRILDSMIEWNKILSKGTHEIILELRDNNKIIMNFTNIPEIITSNVNDYDELINSINKAKRIITPEYIINLNEGDYNATNAIFWKPISKSNLIINGNGRTLNGQNTCQFIKIGTNARLTLNNIILTDYTAYFGGAINNGGELTIRESVFTGNTARKYGGAIYNNNGELTINASAFTDNKTGAYGIGGVIFNGWEGKLTITDSTLTGNTAGYGGAIHNLGELTIIESALTENIANHDGGAIHNLGELTIIESALTENIANHDGGAIHNPGELTITESAFTGNTAREDGGAIFNRGGELTINASAFTKNTVQERGGAIFNRLGELTIIESALTENIANRDGGAIFNYNKISFNIKNCKFKNNKHGDVK